MVFLDSTLRQNTISATSLPLAPVAPSSIGVHPGGQLHFSLQKFLHVLIALFPDNIVLTSLCTVPHENHFELFPCSVCVPGFSLGTFILGFACSLAGLLPLASLSSTQVYG